MLVGSAAFQWSRYDWSYFWEPLDNTPTVPVPSPIYLRSSTGGGAILRTTGGASSGASRG